MKEVSRLIGTALVALVALSCGGGGDTTISPPPPPPPPPANCTTGNFCMTSTTFYPLTTTVAVNAAVTWSNESGVQHDVTFDTPSSALGVGTGPGGNIGPHSSGTNQRRFATAGSYPFICTIHGSNMHGTVIVQ
jgi:plastocyanin